MRRADLLELDFDEGEFRVAGIHDVVLYALGPGVALSGL
jgi:hypothetical protein